MTIEQCRELDCVHVSSEYRRRNCGVTDCSAYQNYYEKRCYAEEYFEFEDCDDEE